MLKLRLLPNFARAPNRDCQLRFSKSGIECVPPTSSFPLHPHTITDNHTCLYKILFPSLCPPLIPLSSPHPTCSTNIPVTTTPTTNHHPTRNLFHHQITNTPPPKEWICSKGWPTRQSKPAAVTPTTTLQLEIRVPPTKAPADKRITSIRVCHVSPQTNPTPLPNLKTKTNNHPSHRRRRR